MKHIFKNVIKNPAHIINIPFLVIIRFYQIILSFDHGLPGVVFPGVRICRHFPSCSAYSYDAIDKYGVFKGGILALKRVLACGPWSEVNKFDPLPVN